MRRSPFLFLACFVPLATTVWAGSEPVAPAPIRETAPTIFTSLSATHYFASEFDGSNAKVQMTRVAFDGEFNFTLTAPWSFRIDFYADVSQYRLSRVDSLLPGITHSPIRNTAFLRLRPFVGYDISRTWRFLVAPTIEIAGETSADVGDAATYGAIFAVQHTFASGIALTLGAGIGTRLEKSFEVYPYVRFRGGSRLFPNIEFETRPNGGAVLYRTSDQFAVYLAGAYETRGYRLKSGGSVSSGIWRERAVPISLGVSWRPAKAISVNAFGGVQVLRNVRLEDSNGDRIFDRDVAATPFAGVEVRGTF